MKASVVVAAIVSITAAPALAGNLTPPADPYVPPPPVPVSDWAGPYAGVQLGFGDLDLSGIAVPGANVPSQSDDGFLGGLHVGYNWDRGTLVYGVEGDIDFTDISFNTTDVDTIARLRLRAGVDTGSAFVYGTAGAAHMTGGGGGVSLDGWGWVAGAGVDFKLSETWVAGADALYHEFDDVSPSGSVDGMTYRLRVSYQF
ncbi:MULTISPECIES: outer membrane protein [unclassified Roseovarius]|uniref:outer membrane protein n=1 Tax=unclassified Roseovarius TaxID=2614913 RepID=UPI00273F49BD|nr:outer membrane beta-barrel protein [Roseovarius sp. MMSF_3350]